ncbi:MAG: electron transfer flavoprotein subunit beta/FixA family protein [Planctomycetes bacterium]|nr:electron transfer flavoprotein subunit beta/FixA family protein [Planctomycetota bacterium]
MEIYVCIKRVADTSEVEIEVDRSGLALEEDDFSWDINEWDNFAVEAAVQLKEKHSGTVTAVTVGGEDDEEVLRRALAMGCDQAIHLCDEAFESADAWGIAKALTAVLKARHVDLLLFGAVSADQSRGQIGGMVAGLMNLPLVSLATSLELTSGKAKVRHEVENGLERVLEVDLPAVITVQTGINEPRYVSIRGIRKVASVDVPLHSATEVGLSAAELQPRVQLEGLFLPKKGEGAQILEGSDDEIIDRLVSLLQENGGF